MWKMLQRTLQSPTLLLALGSLLVLGVLNAAIVIWPNQTQLQAYWQQQGEQLAAEYAQRATSLLMVDDRISLTVEVQRWARQDSLLGVEIIDTQGRTVSASGAVTGQDTLAFSEALYYEDELLGTLTLWQDNQPLAAAFWRSLALLALSISVLAGLGWYLWRLHVTRLQVQQRELSRQLQQAFPALSAPANVEPATQVATLLQQLSAQYGASLDIVRAMQKRMQPHQLATLHEHYQASDQPGQIIPCALVKIDLLNLGALDDRLTPDAIKRLLDQTQHRCEEVLRLYHGENTQDPWLFLVRDHHDEGDFIQRTLCAAYVLNELLRDPTDWDIRPYPEFSVSIMAGPLYAGIQSGNGLPALTVFGHTLQQVETLSTHNKGQQILLGSQTFDYAQLGGLIDAEIYRDIVMPDSETLEIWRLNGFTDNWSRVLTRQVEALRERL